MIICIIACCCPLGIAFAPVPMSVISFAVVLLLMFTPGISLSDAGSIIHMLTPLAIGTLAYSTPTQWSIWGLVTSIVTLLLAFDPREALSQGDALSFFVLLALYIVTYAMCASIRTIAIDDRQRHRDAELELLQTQQAHQREVTRFAQMTHDAVTASLSSIFLLAQQHIDTLDTAGKTADASDEDWRTVRQLSESALASIRSVIRTMNASDERLRIIWMALYTTFRYRSASASRSSRGSICWPRTICMSMCIRQGRYHLPPAHGQATRR